MTSKAGLLSFSCSISSRRYTIVVLHKHMTDVDLDAIKYSWSIMMIVVVISRYIRHRRRFETPRLWLTCQPCRSSISTPKLRPLLSRCLSSPYPIHTDRSTSILPRVHTHHLDQSSTKYLPDLSRLEVHSQPVKHWYVSILG